MMGWNDGGYNMFFGPLFMILVLAATIAAIVLLVRWLSQTTANPAGENRNAPLDILKERFAKGEIDKTEFEERRRVLNG